MSIDMAALPQAARPEMEPTRQALRFRPPCEPPPARDARQLDVRQLTHEHPICLHFARGSVWHYHPGSPTTDFLNLPDLRVWPCSFIKPWSCHAEHEPPAPDPMSQVPASRVHP